MAQVNGGEIETAVETNANGKYPLGLKTPRDLFAATASRMQLVMQAVQDHGQCLGELSSALCNSYGLNPEEGLDWAAVDQLVSVTNTYQVWSVIGFHPDHCSLFGSKSCLLLQR